jgi:formyltetrahydrofolate deformylase
MTSPVDGEAGALAASGKFVDAARGRLPVKDIGRLLLRCADRSGLVAAVSTFLAEAGANIISLDQHSTEQTGGMFMQRTVFHPSGLAAARDDLARDFAEHVAEKFAMDFRLTEAAKPKGWPSWRPKRTTVCWTCCGATAVAISTCRW